MYFSGCCITVQRGLCHLHQTWSNVILCRKSTVGLWDGVGWCWYLYGYVGMIVWISSSCCRSEISWGGGFSRCVRHQNHPKTHGWSYRVSRRVHHVHQFQALQPSTSATGPGYLLVSASPTLYQSKVLVFHGIPAKATRNTRPCPWKNTPSWRLPAQLYPSPLRSNEPSCHLGSWHAGLPVFKKNMFARSGGRYV